MIAIIIFHYLHCPARFHSYLNGLYRVAMRTLVLCKLHWLPIQFRSEFKLATLLYQFSHTSFPKYFAPHQSTYRTTYNTKRSQSVANFLNVPKFQPKIHTSLLSSLASVLRLTLPLFGIHFLKTFAHHPLLPLLERSSKPISTQRHILLSSFPLMASPWC